MYNLLFIYIGGIVAMVAGVAPPAGAWIETLEQILDTI